MKRLLLITVLVVGIAGVAVGDSITFNATGGFSDEGEWHDLAASATFEVIGSQLLITLTNTGPAAEVPSDLLAGVLFDLADRNTLTAYSARLVEGDVVLDGSALNPEQIAHGNLAGEFGFRQDLDTIDPEILRSAQYGVSANGIDNDDNVESVFGVDTVNWAMSGPDLEPPEAPDGANFGLTSAISSGANTGVTDVPVVVGSVQFAFDFTGSLSVDDISNVNFQYGTSLSDPNIHNGIIPEPSTMSLLGIGIAGFLAARKIRRNKRA